nr:unnamed protein product [Callosobruchus chinensis]
MQCLRNKTEVVEIELAKYKVDIFCVSEHWLNEDQVQACTIQGYQLASMYYRSSCKNGGVCIFCRNELGEYVTEIDVSKSVTERTFEICGIELKTYKQKVHIFCLYRTPSSDFKNFIAVFSSFLEYNYKSKRTKDVILVGDWNVDFSSNSLEKNLIQDTLSSFGFQNIVGEATRVSQKSATAIDYVCLNVEQSDYSLSVIFNGVLRKDAFTVDDLSYVYAPIYIRRYIEIATPVGIIDDLMKTCKRTFALVLTTSMEGFESIEIPALKGGDKLIGSASR